ncbi:unnamed protein product [Malus baccata var. baccata]
MEYRKTKRPVALTRSTGDGLQFKLPSDAMLASPWHQIGRSQGLSILGRPVDWHGLGASQLGRLEQIHWVLAYFFGWVLGKKSSNGLALRALPPGCKCASTQSKNQAGGQSIHSSPQT